MSYARWGQAGSDVYVYLSTDGVFLCLGCPRVGDVSVGTAAEMVTHLELDRSAGFNVPQSAIDELRSRGDDDQAQARRRL
jgi:hypothetical protein